MTPPPPGFATPTEIESTFRRIYWRTVPLLIVCYILAYMDRANVGFAKLHFMGDLGFNEAVFGLGGGLFYLGYSLFEVPSNLIMARVGARLTLLRIMILWGACSAALAFMAAPSHYYSLRFLLGVAEAGFFPGALFYISTWIPASRRARFTAMFMSAIGIAGVIGGPLSGAVIVGFEGVAGLRGWQWMFLVEGLPACIMGVVVYFTLADRPSEAMWLSPRQREIVESELAAEVRDTRGSRHHSFGAALKDPRFYVLVGMSGGMIAGGAGIFLWLPTIIRQSGVSDIFHIGLLSSLPFIIAIVLQQLWARHSDRAGERRWHAAVPAMLAGLGWVLLPSVQTSVLLSMCVLTLMAIGYLCAMGPFWTMPSLYLSGSAAAGGIALITTAGSIAAFFAPTIVGWLTTNTGSPAWGQYFYGLVMMGGALMLLAGTKPIPRDVAVNAPSPAPAQN